MRKAGVEVREPRDDEDLARFSDVLRPSLQFPPEQSRRLFADIGNENLRVVTRAGRVAGGLAIYPTGQGFHGRSVPCAGIAAVAVAAEHRAEGVGRTLMAETVRSLHRRGFAISTLYPATYPLYRSVGYEAAGCRTEYALRLSSIDVREKGPPLKPLPTGDPAVFRDLYAARARATAGNLDRSPWFWARTTRTVTDPLYAYAIPGKRGPAEGYVTFTLPTVGGANRYDVRVRDLVVNGPVAARRVLSFFAMHRSMGDFLRWCGPPVDPLHLHLREPTPAVEGRHFWMTRIVDVPAALAARGYAPGVAAEVHLEVRDDLVPENDGRFVLRVRGGRGSARRGGRGTVQATVRGLAPLFTGHLSAEALRGAGLLDGPAEALAAASAAFAGPAPWMPEMF
jgi:predicted acetyltransferase